MRHLIDAGDLSRPELEDLLARALEMAANPRDFADCARGRILATLFYEPSTRTRLSFESAMLSLGGATLGFAEPNSSSASKGESLADSVRTVACYSDLIALRHPREGAAMMAALSAGVPVINAGDGGHAHPTQTLTDLLTLRRELGRIDGLTVGLCGDLKNGRTVHSLIHALSLFEGVRLVLIAPQALALPGYARPDSGRLTWTETESLEAALPGLDVLYMTRIQRERFDDPAEYAALRGRYILDPAKMALLPREAAVLHPLPRVDEIDPRVDDDRRAAYFRQAQNGRYVRMALLESVLAGRMTDRPPAGTGAVVRAEACQNPRCISRDDPAHRRLWTPRPGGGWRCLYCEQEG